MTIPTEKFATVPLFQELEPGAIARILALAEDVETAAGARIVAQGEPGDGFYVIAAGVFEVVHATAGGDDKTLARLEQLSFFGEMSLVSDEPRSASVVCVEAGRLKRIPKQRFRDLLDRDDLSAYKVIVAMSRIMAHRLSRLEDEFVG